MILRQIRVSVRKEVKQKEIAEVKEKRRKRRKERQALEIGSDEFIEPSANHDKHYKRGNTAHIENRSREETQGDVNLTNNRQDSYNNYQYYPEEGKKFRSNLREDPETDGIYKKYGQFI